MFVSCVHFMKGRKVGVKVRVGITIAPQVHRQGKALGREDSRTFSNLVAWLIANETERRQPQPSLKP